MFAATDLPASQERELHRDQLRPLTQLRHVKRGSLANSLDTKLFALLVAKVRGVDQDLARRVATLDDQSSRHAVCRCVVVAFDHPDGRTRRALARVSASS